MLLAFEDQKKAINGNGFIKTVTFKVPINTFNLWKVHLLKYYIDKLLKFINKVHSSVDKVA